MIECHPLKLQPSAEMMSSSTIATPTEDLNHDHSPSSPPSGGAGPKKPVAAPLQYLMDPQPTTSMQETAKTRGMLKDTDSGGSTAKIRIRDMMIMCLARVVTSIFVLLVVYALIFSHALCRLHCS